MTDGELRFGDDSPLASLVREVIGVGPYDKVGVNTPQFGRTDGLKVGWFPSCVEDLEKIKTLSHDILTKILGLGCYCKNGFGAMYLFPGEWYDHIPEGYTYVDIFGEKGQFEKGVTDDDIRFGCLSYGIETGDTNLLWDEIR